MNAMRLLSCYKSASQEDDCAKDGTCAISKTPICFRFVELARDEFFACYTASLASVLTFICATVEPIWLRVLCAFP